MDSKKDYAHTFCVYKHTNKINGKVYIDQTKNGSNPWLRWGHNAWGYSGKYSYLDNTIAKYGWENFEHEILHNNLTSDEANYWEIEEIKNHNATNPKFGYNQTQGGYNGLRNKEVGQKISLALNNYYKDNPVPEERNIRRGKSIFKYYEDHPEAGKDKGIKISKAMTGKKYHIKPNKINNNTGIIKINNGKETKTIFPDELNIYLAQGWVLGYKPRILPSNTGRIKINNGSVNKFILPEELNFWESQGWIRGGHPVKKNENINSEE